MIGNSLPGERLAELEDAPSYARRMMRLSRLPSPTGRTLPHPCGALSSMRPRVLKPLLVVISTGFVLALGTAAPASAAVPCWKALINDWYDGQIDRLYPAACYTAALRHLPRDVETYSSAKEDINRALLDAIRNDRERGEPATYDPNDPASSGSSSGGGGDDGSSGGGSSEESSKGIITRTIEWLGPSNATSIPLPLLILAGVAFLLLAAAGGSFVHRRLQDRRPPPQP